VRHQDILTRLEREGYHPVYNYRFHPERDWRFAFAWPEDKIALDYLDRHAVDPTRIIEAQLLGWIVLPVTEQIAKGPRLCFYLDRAFARRDAKLDKLIDGSR